MTDMNLDHLPDVTATQLRWYDQLAEVPRALYHAFRRLLRLECRQYLVINGQVAARFTSVDDGRDFMMWLHETHTATFDYGYGIGKENAVAKYFSDAADAGDPGPA